MVNVLDYFVKLINVNLILRIVFFVLTLFKNFSQIEKEKQIAPKITLSKSETAIFKTLQN